MKCPYCKNDFTAQSSLNKHLKNAKYCLKLRNENNTNFTCKYCDENISSNERLILHEHKCKEEKDRNESIIKNKQLQVENEDLKSENISLLNEVEYLKHELKENKEQIQDLQNKLENITLKAISRPISTTNNNKIQTFIQNNAQAITPEYLQSQVVNLTKEHILRGAAGYAQYAMDYPLKNNIKCSDVSRKKLHYKDGCNNVVTDHNMDTLTPMIFSSIEEKTKDIVNNLDEIRNTNSDNFGLLIVYNGIIGNVKAAARGETSDFSNEFSRRICSSCIN